MCNLDKNSTAMENNGINIGNYIKYDETKEFESLNLLYPDVKLDFSGKNKFRSFIEHFLDEEDRFDTMIAGGIFSSYQNQSIFSQNMPELYILMKNNQDIDLFIHDNARQDKFIKYYERLCGQFLKSGFKRERNYLDNSTDSDKIYEGVHTFKIKVVNHVILNFIFINKEEYQSLISFLKTFDFAISKIFYSYNEDEIFVLIQI